MTYIQSLNIQNFQLGKFEGDGNFDIPKILPLYNVQDCKKWYGLREVPKTYDTHNCGLHFFLDDYRFQCVWNNPINYLDILHRYRYVLAPDFSMFVDYPKALCMYNHYRKHWCARYWQENGIDVIPVINWMYDDSFEWCFDGEPCNAIVAVSSKGVCNSKAMIDMFRTGYAEMERKLQPTKVLWFGKYCLEEPRGNVMMIKTTFDDRIAMLRREHSKQKEEPQWEEETRIADALAVAEECC